MKTLYESLLDDFDTLSSKIDAEDSVIQYLQANYFGCKKEYVTMRLGDDGKYIVDLSNDLMPRKIKLKELTNGLFVFGTIQGCVDLEGTQISSLEGSPRKVFGFFDCSHCKNLTSLKGSPELVTQNFYCNNNPKLKSLKDGPKTVEGSFYCGNCGKQFKVNDVINAKIDVRVEIDL
jgi:hypothetical protein